MTEVLFVLTVIFVAYVFCVIINDKKIIGKFTTPAAVEPEKQANPIVEPPSPEPVPKAVPPKTTQAKPAKIIKPTATEKPAAVKKGLKNPKTGEITTTYTNYIFTKRWIKEALVAEGLLEKVYKNNELNTKTEALIKAAIIKLEAMDQYKV